ncbi:MAG: HD-GYP domain-containing protein [Betaproteobacteria bacterium]|nr:HD-GYP domain-containing protein [Betaproteobacteria bacterium]
MSQPEDYLDIDIAQLRVGLYITLDMHWMDHPFVTNTFKIKDEEQIKTIRHLGLKKIRYCPAKSSGKPLDPPKQASAPAPVQVSPEEQAAMQAKKERVERLSRHRQSVMKCEKQLLEATRALKAVSHNLFSRPQESVRAAQDLVDKMIDSLLNEKDIAIHAMNDKVAGEDVYHHSLNVSILAMILAKEMGLSKEEISLVGLGAVFHDIGKSQIPDRILRKTEPLTKPEQNFLDQHPSYGKEIALSLRLPLPVQEIILYHHEHVDGSGYPHGLRESAISQLTRIITVVNTFDNLCNHVNIAKSLTPYEAISTMFAKQRAMFDQAALTLFIRSMGVYPPGTIVKLSNDLWGIVVSINVKKPLKPNVLVYDPEVPKQEAIVIDLDEQPDISISKTFRPAQLPRDVFDYLSPRTRITYYFDDAPDSQNKA